MTVIVRPATDEDLAAIAAWLGEPEIAKWLDFGPGRSISATALKYAMARGTERYYTFSPDDRGEPAGVVGLSQIHPRFRTAMLWYALGDQRMGGRGLTTRAVETVVEIAFAHLELGAINAWTVAGNRPSERILQKTGFQLIGRQRRCHYIAGEPHDRLLFDLLSSQGNAKHGA